MDPHAGLAPLDSAAEERDPIERALGITVGPGEIRALFTAATDWGTASRDMHPGDWYIVGEGLRALRDDERDLALSYFTDDALMARAWRLASEASDVSLAVGALDPVGGPAEEAMALDPKCERRDQWPEHRRQAEETYRSRVSSLAVDVLDAIAGIYKPRDGFKPATRRALASTPAAAPARARNRESHRGRPGHSTRRRATARDGPDDGPGEPPAAARCSRCGGALLWSDGRLLCANRRCDAYGKGGAA